MARDELSGKADAGGFVEYDKSQLPKANTQRRDKSQPDFYGIPILTDAQVGYSTDKELGGHPASCYTCGQQNSDMRCNRLGPMVAVEKVLGSKDSGDQIEYWPCCDEHEYCQEVADGQRSKPDYRGTLDTPQSLGLIWINAPKPGLKFGGANCGGVNNGDDCDHYITYGKVEKWNTASAYCRVLAHDVASGDVCRAWHDDDELPFQEAQQLIRGDTVETVEKRRMARAIIGRSDADS